MEQVINLLNREEPDYAQAAQLGSEALPHLVTLIQGENPGLAAKAASLAGVINAAHSVDVLRIAAQHPNPVVRVAAAASAKNLTSMPTSLAMNLLNDSDAGVRKWVLKSLEVHHPAGVKTKVEEIMKSDPDVGLRDRAKQILNQLP
ncbi:MAG: hypothetical protein ACXW3C_01400 [Pyrinomonadaceae bacterium]